MAYCRRRPGTVELECSPVVATRVALTHAAAVPEEVALYSLFAAVENESVFVVQPFRRCAKVDLPEAVLLPRSATVSRLSM